ncbi:SRPBCC family protein [Nocardia yunnanensis]|uniref:SRPBCC family protein n=1 Tax=Nocardia yunnanensis TaxID=2382165 RepID=A0A386ZMF0_9NOCA|nr:SRPBCC family protein [Nocardia yunnanensis]AYF77755.1 SRPBCC family protein [Nocardia yunnanensis]
MTKQNLTATIAIDAAPQQVWSAVSDLRRMPEWSEQCRLMRPLGTVREGARTLNMNRQGWKYWPTTSRIERFEPGRVIAFRTLSNNSVWSFEITPTPTGSTLTHRRTVPPSGTTWISRTIVEHLLGGEEPFDLEMVAGMQATIARIKSAVELSHVS